LKAAIYCRVSTEEQAKEGFSIAAQKKTLLYFCEMKKWSIANIYVDEGVSGKSTKRPAFLQMIEDAASGYFDVILVWKINRFSRKNSDLLNTVEYLRKYGVNLISYSEQFDASTPSGKLLLSMLGSIGEFERDTLVENIRAGMKERAEQGLFNGGRVLGYDTVDGKLVINEKEATTVRRIFDLYLKGNGYSDICRILREENKTTKNNCQFQINSIKRILKNPIYAGYITYNKSTKIINKVIKNDNFICTPGSHDKIIPESTFQKVQEIMDSKKQSYCNHNSYILTPVLKCPYCGGKMTGHTGNRKKDGSHYRYYICCKYKTHSSNACDAFYINAEKIESEVIDSICSLILKENIIEDIYKYIRSSHRNTEYYCEIENLKKELSHKKKTLDKYMNLFESNSLNEKLFEQRLMDLNTSINIIEKRIQTASNKLQSMECDISYERIYGLIKDFKSIFLHMNNKDKKKIISSIVKQVQVSPGKNKAIITYNFSF